MVVAAWAPKFELKRAAERAGSSKQRQSTHAAIKPSRPQLRAGDAAAAAHSPLAAHTKPRCNIPIAYGEPLDAPRDELKSRFAAPTTTARRRPSPPT